MIQIKLYFFSMMPDKKLGIQISLIVELEQMFERDVGGIFNVVNIIFLNCGFVFVVLINALDFSPHKFQT